MLKRFKSSIAILCLSLTSTLTGLPSANAATAPDVAAYNWLVSQQQSNGLVTSFKGGNVAYTYDQAVAVIGFLLEGDTARAKKVLNELKSLQLSTGGWYDSYYSKSGTKQENSETVGNVAWVALAVMNYEKQTGDTTTYHTMAVNGLNWLLQYQQSDGGINGGIASNGSLDTWASTENNEDCYTALNYFGFTTQATNVKSFLDNVVWDNTNGRFYGGRNDTRDPMDVNAWGVLSLGLSGTHPYSEGLTYNINHELNTQTLNGVSYTDFDFDSDQNDIWFEGSSFMVIAERMNGDTTDATNYLNNIVKDQGSDGGVQYSLLGTNNGYWTMSNKEAVSSTGWLIMAEKNYNPYA